MASFPKKRRNWPLICAEGGRFWVKGILHSVFRLRAALPESCLWTQTFPIYFPRKHSTCPHLSVHLHSWAENRRSIRGVRDCLCKRQDGQEVGIYLPSTLCPCWAGHVNTILLSPTLSFSWYGNFVSHCDLPRVTLSRECVEMMLQPGMWPHCLCSISAASGPTQGPE